MLSRFRSVKRDKSESGSLIRKADGQISKHAMKDAGRELFSFDKPTQELGMTSLIQQHNAGDRFLYAAVTTAQEEEDSSRLRRLLQHQPKLNRKSQDINSLPRLELYKETEVFGLSTVIKSSKSSKGMKKYINISEVLIVYGSLISSDTAFTKVRVSIMDDRLIQNKVAKSYVANTNLISKATIGLSYSFPEDEVDKISLTLSREAAFLEEGSQWGVAQVQIRFTITDFPIQLANAPIRAVNAIPQSALEDRDVDPDFIDISMTNDNRVALRDMYMEGDLADETEPIKNRTEAVKYAKSSIHGAKGKKSNKVLPQEWNFMNDGRSHGIQAGMNSVEPSEDGFEEPLPKSIIKRPGTPVRRPESSDTEEVVRSPRRVVLQEPESLF